MIGSSLNKGLIHTLLIKFSEIDGHITPIVMDNARMTIPHPKAQTFCAVGVQPQHILMLHFNTRHQRKPDSSNKDNNFVTIETNFYQHWSFYTDTWTDNQHKIRFDKVQL